MKFATAAELVPAPERTVARETSTLSLDEAAAVPLAGPTAWQALTEALEAGAGDRVPVHAASGGVGQLAVQIAVTLGAEVIGGEALADAPAQVRGGTRIASIIEADTVLEQGGRYVFVSPDRSHLDALGRLFNDGSLTVTVARTFELADIADAHRLF